MKKPKLGLEELAHLTCSGLAEQGIEVTLSGGACVTIYSKNAYQSMDLDFIRQIQTGIEEVAKAMLQLGFKRNGRHFTHPESDYYVEFPPPPLTVGKEAPKSVVVKTLRSKKGTFKVRMLSATDCVKDRLCQFFFWKDLQSLDQAVLVAKSAKVDVPELKRWAANEGMSEKFGEFLSAMAKRNSRKSG